MTELEQQSTLGRPFLWGAVIAALLGVAISIDTRAAALVVAVVGSVAFVWAFLRYPKTTLLVVGVFLLLQDLLVALAGTWSPTLAIVLKRGEEAVIALMFVLTLLKRPLRVTRVELSIAALAIVGLLSTVLAGGRLFPGTLDLFLMVKGFLLFVIGRSLRWTRADLTRLTRVFAILGVVILCTAAIDYLVPGWQRAVNLAADIHYRVGLQAVQGLFAHPGAFGNVMATLALYSLAIYVVVRRRQSMFLGLLFGVGVLLSLRLRPLLAMPAAVLAVSALVLRNKQSLRLGLALSIVALPLLPIFWQFAVQIFSLKSAVFLTESPRLLLTQTSLKIAGDFFPLGSGLGSFGGWISRLYYSPIYEQYGLSQVYGLSQEHAAFIMDTHWPYVLAEIGVFGLALYLFTFWVIVRPVIRAARSSHILLHRGLAVGVLLVLVEYVLEGFVSPIFQSTRGVYFSLFAASVVAGFGDRTAVRSARPASLDASPATGSSPSSSR